MRSVTDPAGRPRRRPIFPAAGRLPASAALTCCVLALAGSAFAQSGGAALDAAVDRAIRRGLDTLYAMQRPDGTWATPHASRHPGGVEALVLLTALSAGEDPDQAKLKAALAYVKGIQPPSVYARAMRVMVYARLKGADYRKRLEADVAWLRPDQKSSGGWGYGPGHPMTVRHLHWTDTSNSQLAILALHEAATAGVSVPESVWKPARTFWTRAQNPDGGWGYAPPGSAERLRGSSYGTMTAAGLATVLILRDHLAGAANDGESGEEVVVTRAIDWLTKNHKPRVNPKWIWGAPQEWSFYYAWCLARAASAAGLRIVGRDDWYRSTADMLLARHRDGAWADPKGDVAAKPDPAYTCFAILALLQGRGPVLINRLDLAGRGPVHTRDAANLVDWFGRRFSTPGRWQAVRPGDPPHVLAEATILYVDASVEDAKFDDKLAEKLGQFVRDGGTVLVQAKPGSPAAVATLKDKFLKVLPDFGAQRLDTKHPLFGVQYPVPPVEGLAIGDPSCTRIFIVSSDLTGPWAARDVKGKPDAFGLFANLLFYATDGDLPKVRLARRAPSTAMRVSGHVALARVRHKGDWSTCPRMESRLSEVLARAVSVGIRETPPVDLSQDVPHHIPLLWMTGSQGPDLSAEQIQRLKKYLRAGGTLMIDPAVGKVEFFDAASKMLKDAFGPGSLKRLAAGHPLLSGNFADGMGSDVGKAAFTRAAGKAQSVPELWHVDIDGRAAVVLSRYGLTCPVEGNPTFGQLGLATDDARRLAANVVLYAATHGGK